MSDLIDSIRKQIQERLDQLLSEAEKLRRALSALGSDRSSPGPSQRPPARTRSPGTRARRASPGRRRTPAGATKSKVLSALTADTGRTAGEVAAATGLPRTTVSTTLSRLAKTGEVRKAERGYRLP